MFFFSIRRRHTRSLRDWSSDVCSSDLNTFDENGGDDHRDGECGKIKNLAGRYDVSAGGIKVDRRIRIGEKRLRSEERRVGKDSSTRWATLGQTKKLSYRRLAMIWRRTW